MPHLEQVRFLFVEHMEAELKANEHKGNFADYRPANELIGSAWLEEHVQKLYRALAEKDPKKVREHCADVAVIAMKLEECFGPKSDAV